MSHGIATLIKQAAIEAMENGQPTDLRTGIVISDNPLKIQITPQFILPESALIVPRHLTDYKVTVSFNWDTDYAGGHSHTYVCAEGGTNTTDNESNHAHNIKSVEEKELTIHNKLQQNDKVALLKQKGGQFYYILDRIE